MTMSNPTTQTRILDAIASGVRGFLGDDGKVLDVTVDYEFTNTGVIGAVRTTDVLPLHPMRFSFQRDSARFEPIVTNHAASARGTITFHYTRPERAAGQIAGVVAYLTDGLSFADAPVES